MAKKHTKDAATSAGGTESVLKNIEHSASSADTANIKKSGRLQWHPAFYAGLQIALEEERDHLIFENEHQLGTKPKAVDVLIIKKEGSRPVRKSIGKIFRGHNIVEYKGVTDNLTIDDFYQGYGYACFYKADSVQADAIPIEEITLTFACHKYPRKLFRHLQEERKLEISAEAAGIYSVRGDYLPMQILLVNQLPEEDYLWLRNLTDHLESPETVDKLTAEYQKHKDQNLYQSVMDMIIRANKKKFEEARNMCEALRELFADELEEKLEEKLQEQEEIFAEKLKVKCRESEQKVNNLNVRLLELGRTDDMIKAASDREFQERLYEELGI